MPAQRKLFIAHAGELAHLLALTMSRAGGSAGMAPEFLRTYGQRFGRGGILSNPTRFLDMQYNITREALLVAAVDIHPRLPQAFAHSRGHRVEAEDAALAESFFAEFQRSLSHALDWRPAEEGAEQESFRRDLELYKRWTSRPASRSENRRQAAVGYEATTEESPFPDRCALLLDPAMMEQARRAAVEFEREILRAARHIFAQLGAAPRASARPRRQAKPKRKLAPRRRASTSRRAVPRSRPRRKPRPLRGRPKLLPAKSRSATRPRRRGKQHLPRQRAISLRAAGPRAKSRRGGNAASRPVARPRARSSRCAAKRKRSRRIPSPLRRRRDAASRRARPTRRRR